jgi:acyl-CoA dehydrogenase
VAYDCVQLHGGYGYMREYPIERFFRDYRLMTIGGGTSEIMKEIIAKQMRL